MHTFAAARRPRAVYGRARAAQRRTKVYDSESEESERQCSREHDAESSQDEDEHAVETQLFDKTYSTSERRQKQKGKAKAAEQRTRRPMQARAMNGAQERPIDVDKEEEHSTEEDVIRSPQRRRGTVVRPIVIPSSPSASSSSDTSAHMSRRGQDEDESVTELTHAFDLAGIHTSDGIEALLQSCDRNAVLTFEEALDEMENEAESTSWKKVGEATYSEVFSIVNSGKVLKVIPLRSQTGDVPNDGVQYPEWSSFGDVQREIIMTRTLAETDQTFVTLHRATVVRGAYSRRLLHAWDVKEAETQNVRPDVFAHDQLFCLLLLSDGGRDLESFPLTSWSEAASIVVQVAKALAKAESSCKFEHRDLHWGNIVIRSVKQGRLTNGQSLGATRLASPRWSGVQATIIDFTLSRAEVAGTTKDVVYHPFDDEGFFSGSGDIQFDVYRAMRDVTKAKGWRDFYPVTNLMWLHYLTTKIIDDKKLSPPAAMDEKDGANDVTVKCHSLLLSLQMFMRDQLARPDKSDENKTIPNMTTICDQIDVLLTSTAESDSDHELN